MPQSGGWSGGGHKKGRYRHDQGGGHGKYKPKQADRQDGLDDNSPVIQSFRQFAKELDARHDKYERIVKLSRDITIDSKRIIFLLHTITGDSKKEEILVQADLRLKMLETSYLRAVAIELKGEDPYQYLRAYSPGLQEYVEAKTFYNYLKNEDLEDWKKIQKEITFEMKPIPAVLEPGQTLELTTISKDGEPEQVLLVSAPLPPIEYILGVADLTGELMRRCISCAGSGQLDSCYQACSFMREIHRGFLGTNCQGSKELGRKFYVLRQSLLKTETACYTIHVRGSEVPKHLLADVLNLSEDTREENEGFY